MATIGDGIKIRASTEREPVVFSLDAGVVCEALCREMAEAQRWDTVLHAWRAMQNVRRIWREMKE